MNNLSTKIQNKKLLIFDCDGTLFDTMSAHYDAWCEAYQDMGYEFCDKEFFLQHLAGISSKETVAFLNDKCGYKIDYTKIVRNKEELFLNKYICQISPIESVIAIAKKHYGKLPMVVASGGEAVAVNMMLDAAKIKNLFNYIVTIEDVKNCKPAPDIFLKAAELVNVNPANCLVFEDSNAGFLAAQRAGMNYVDVAGML